MAVNQTNPNLVVVCDGGTSQQVKAIDTNGTSLWTYGTAAGDDAGVLAASARHVDDAASRSDVAEKPGRVAAARWRMPTGWAGR